MKRREDSEGLEGDLETILGETLFREGVDIFVEDVQYFGITI